MKGIKMDRTSEKIALAESLGLRNYLSGQKEKLLLKKDIEDLTAMNYKPIHAKAVAKMIGKKLYFNFNKDSDDVIFPFVVIPMIIGALAFLIGISNLFVSAPPVSALKCLLLSAVCTSLMFANWLSWTEIIVDSLESWRHDLPYGALLAVKEAKDKGLENFKIYYPAKQRRKFSADPVITAKSKAGTEVMIFAWDDRKVYE
jgi:hypothetical protein